MLPTEIDQGLTCPACGVEMRIDSGAFAWCEQWNGCAFSGSHHAERIVLIHSLIAAARKPTVPRLELHGGKWTLTLPGDGVPLSQAADIIESAAKAVGEVKP